MIEGTVIGNRYAISRLLGEGGMGCVYEARHLGTGRKVALKMIAAELVTNASVVARLEAEAQAAGSIDSDHITQVVDVGRDDATGAPFLVMELLDGEDLGELVQRLGPLDPMLVARLGVQIAMGLEAAHGKSIVHRDLKPANIFLSRRDGGEVKVKILDFGISKSLDQDARPQSNKLTKTGTIMGSPVYMSPEQTRAKNIDHRSDIWSFGVVLYELLTGTTPFDSAGAIADLIIDICTGRIPPVTERAPWTPAPLAAVVDRALVRDPAARWPSAREMRAALEACLPELRPIRMADLLAANRPPVARPSASRAGADTGLATPVNVSEGASAAGSRAGQTAIAVGRPAPVATVAFDPSVDAPLAAPIPARPNTTTSGVVGAGAAAPAKKGSPVVWIAAAAVAAGLGVGGFFALKGPSSPAAVTSDPSAASAKGVPSAAPDVASTAAGSTSASRPSASSSPAPSAAPTIDARLSALAGKWVSKKGNHYDAVVVGDVVEFRVRDANELAKFGYATGEVRFSIGLERGSASDTFVVADHLRVDPETGGYAGKKGPDSCAIDIRFKGEGVVVVNGDELKVTMASVRVTPANFVMSGAVVASCTGLGALKPTRIESVYTREK